MANVQKTPRAAVNSLILLALLAATAAAPGCFPDNRNQALGPAPVVDTDAPDAETAYWRDQYRKNRTVPPREFSVAPKKARNNDFGEFDDSLYANLDSQPSLPRLPGGQDLMPMMGGGDTYPAAAALPPQRRTAAGDAAPVSSPMTAAAVEGVDSGAHFYPLEQLVFGGDYPDIDKPDLYRLMPKDAVSVTVKDHPEFSGKPGIQPDGTVRIPNTTDLIRLRGLTVDEAAEEIRRVLQVYIKGECVVRVQVNRARGGYYFVFGDVNQPGRFPMGLEPVKLSDAILAANWEANPNRMDEDDELGPAFPAAGPRGAFNSPASADLARVMLITPHRSQPVRTTHDIRSAMLGMTNNDPALRPGQIIVVPSLDPRKNASLGFAAATDGPSVPEALMPGRGFSDGDATARLPFVDPDSHPVRRRAAVTIPGVEGNMASTYQVQANTPAVHPEEEEVWYDDMSVFSEMMAESVVLPAETPEMEKAPATIPAPDKESPVPATEPKLKPAPASEMTQRRRGRRLERSIPMPRDDAPSAVEKRNNLEGWEKGF